MSAETIAIVRRNTNEPDSTTYTDADIQTILDAYAEDTNLASAQIWREKAATYAGLVNMQEGNSRRDLSDLHKNALGMSAFWANGGGTTPGTARTVRITRA